MRAICCNHDCPRFEVSVAVSDDVADAESERCSLCKQLLVHESGLTFRDALGGVVRAGDVVRYRPAADDDWIYAEVARVDEQGAIYLASRQSAPRGRQLREKLEPGEIAAMRADDRFGIKP